MSKMLDASIKCPNCGHEQKMSLFRSIWAEYADNRQLILEDKINLFRCEKCTHEERLAFPFLCTNVERGVAIWYEPYHDPQIDEDAENYRKHMGKDSFYAKAPRIADWETFKTKFLEMDAAGPQPGQEVKHSKESQEQLRGFVDSQERRYIPCRRAVGQFSDDAETNSRRLCAPARGSRVGRRGRAIRSRRSLFERKWGQARPVPWGTLAAGSGGAGSSGRPV